MMNIFFTVFPPLFVVGGFSNAECSPMPFYASSGGSFLYMSNFSKEASFTKFRNALVTLNETEQRGRVQVLPTAGEPFKYFGVEYYISESSYMSNERKIKWNKHCKINLNETNLLNDIFLSDETSPVETLIWSCPAHGWCCGIECCQPYFKTPWAVIGPDAIAVVFGVFVFIVCLGLMEVIARLKAVLQKENDNRKSDELTDDSIPSDYCDKN
ncbi:hypothetical protein Tcan_05347 [Toxocara canis]|uniref:CX domain-containing protein n=2 Tax=Toxocara canis TaxID=6265 RepID=A0A0B2VUX3_TOXCA|nr:hypothetical protein Tcan_05347 [Toxocara canis]VDM47335.1 unnamed protein product [Toxocara canis]